MSLQPNGVIEDALSSPEYDRLEELETIVSKGLAGFFEVGKALNEINEKRLYRQYHQTFEAYLADQWQIDRSRGYQMIVAAQVADEMSTMVDIPQPANERQARALKPLSGQPAKMAEAMAQAAEATDGKPTAKAIKDAVDDIVDPDLAIRLQKDADRAARKADQDAKKARQSAAEADLLDRAADEFDDVAAAALNRKTRDALDNLSAVLACDPDAAAMACPSSQTPARLAQLDLLDRWSASHRARLNGTPLHLIRGTA